MRLFELFTANQWLSIEYTLLSIYPDQKEGIHAYRDVYEKLLEITPIEKDMQIALTRYFDEDADGGSYVDVSGYIVTTDLDSTNISYALEFTPWAEWLGMTVNSNSLSEFSELEILSHCMYEMTFFGYDEEKIQSKFSDINDDIEEYKNNSSEEKRSNTKSIDDLFNEED